MNNKTFRQFAHQFVDWMADYLENIEHLPVKPNTLAGSVLNQLPEFAPAQGEDMATIFADFQTIIMPNMVHWQHPNFFAYFPANSSYPSVLAEMLTATLGAQCMMWETSPAAAELEERVMSWLGNALGLPPTMQGVIQDTASSASLVALLTARERFTKGSINERGFENNHAALRVYCSSQAHSSIEKAVKIMGIGKNNLVKIAVDAQQRLRPELLAKAIEHDLANGLQPLCVVAAFGTTGTTAIDPLPQLAAICAKHNLWLHVDAAYAGTALLLPEFRHLLQGIEQVDSFVVNPHKWMFTNFDCTAYFVKDVEALKQTFSILPEYLKTPERKFGNDYKDWGIQLGRRFRSLKLWFVMRSFGLEGIKATLREHIKIAEWLADEIKRSDVFELMTEPAFNLVCFRYCPKQVRDTEMLDALNEQLLQRINASGQAYLSHTRVNERYTLRLVVAHSKAQRADVEIVWQLIQQLADGLDV